MSPIEHEIEQWEGRKGSRCGIRPFGQRRIKENLKKKRKSIIVAGIKEKHVKNVPFSVLNS